MPCGLGQPSAATSGYGHGHVSLRVLVSSPVSGGRRRGSARCAPCPCYVPAILWVTAALSRTLSRSFYSVGVCLFAGLFGAFRLCGGHPQVPWLCHFSGLTNLSCLGPFTVSRTSWGQPDPA